MDNQFLSAENQINLPRQNIITRVKPVLIIASILVLGFILGFLTSSFTSTPKNQENNPVLPEKPAVDESKLPISLSLLTNPIIYEWQGSVEGNLVSKANDNFTLEKNDHTLTITVKPNYTFFRKEGSLGFANITLSDVPLGVLVRGTVWIALKDKVVLTNTPGDIVGSGFSFSLPAKK